MSGKERIETLERKERKIILISCYELGHQPVGIASAAAFLERAGYQAAGIDVSVEGFDSEQVRDAWFIGISVPMHTALRLGVRIAEAVREVNSSAHICFYGLYASLNSDYLLGTVASSVVGVESEEPLVNLVRALDEGAPTENGDGNGRMKSSLVPLARLDFPVPARASLPKLDRYAKLEHNGEQRLAGYVEASRGCLHNCTHCPIPPVYGGRFFAVPADVVREDIRRLVESGARHITFGDPDFLNGPTHSLRIVRAIHEEFPEITFDFTAKIEHLLKQRALLQEFARTGCIFIVSAVESLSDEVLANLEKGHTRRDVFDALQVVREAGIALRPTFVPFTPWATTDDYIDLIESVESRGLIDHVDPVQYTIRLLIPPGSLLLDRPDSQRWLGRLNQQLFTYEWAHPDPGMDSLQHEVSELVERDVSRGEDPAATFFRIRELAFGARGDQGSGRGIPDLAPLRLRPPRLTEAWFC
jgi:radical SAM superfamily enzyme YgiQ (UPF0313 family)